MAELPRGCTEVDVELSALVDGELDAQARALVEGHLAGCARCRERLAALRAVDAALGALPAPGVPADLAARLARRVAAAPDRDAAAPLGARGSGRLAPRWAAWIAPPAAAAAALALYLALRPAAAPEAPQLAGESAPPRGAAAGSPAAPAPARPAPETRLAAAPPAPPAASEVRNEASPPAPPAEAELEALGTEDLAVVLDLETMQDLPVIANLDLLERLLDEGGPG